MKKIFITIFLAIMIIIFFTISAYKKNNIGNNISKSDYIDILNISAYEATIEVTVYSNKNTNKYILYQKYDKPNILEQDVLEPVNIKGLKTIFDGTNLTIKNEGLNVKTVYENFEYIKGNSLSLISFIEEYKENPNIETIETEEERIIEIKLKEENKYKMYKKIYIDKKTKLPTKMEILDINKNISVYILYKEIKIKSSK